MDHDNGVIKFVESMKITGIYFSFDSKLQTDKNYEGVIDKIQNIVKLWKCRNISLLGRVQIAKTYIFSQVRFLTNFVKPAVEFLNDFKKIVTNYIWNGSEKVKRLSAIADYDEGGLRLPDIDAIIETQNILWVKRYLCNKTHPWTHFFKIQLKKLGDERLIFHRSFDLRLITNSAMDEQHKDILSSWLKYNNSPIDSANILDQQIFCNKDILTRNGKSICYKNLIDKGIFYIKDLIGNNNLMTVEEAIAEKNLNNIEAMQYFSVLKCLTNHQKNLVTTAEPSNRSPQEKIIFKLERENSKIIYWDLIKNKKETPTSEDKIRHKFNIEVSQVEWHQIYTVPVCTIEMKLQSFQFSINHFYYFSNDKLHRIGKSQTPNCSFCKTEVETISHLFLDCTKIQCLWNFFNHILTQLDLYENVTNIIKLMGFYTKASDKKYETRKVRLKK